MGVDRQKTTIYIDRQLKQDLLLYGVKIQKRLSDVIEMSIRQFLRDNGLRKGGVLKEFMRYPDPELAQFLFENGLDPNEMLHVPQPGDY